MIDQAREYIGPKGYDNNPTTDTMTVSEIIAALQNPFKVHGSFRMVKTGLRARPMFRHEKDSISAHLTIVF